MPAAPAIRIDPSRSPRSARRRWRRARTESRSPGSQRRLLPREPAPAIGIVAARQADFVAVVDRRRARERRLEEHRQLGAAGIAPEHRPQARRIVRAEHVELDGDDVGVVRVARAPSPSPRTRVRRAAAPRAGTRDGCSRSPCRGWTSR